MLKISLILLLLLVSPILYASSFPCPATIAKTKTLKSWSIYQGKIGDTRFELAPEESHQKNKLIQIWQFDNKQSYWIQCHYNKTQLTLNRKIPANIKQCKREYKLDKKHNAIGNGVISCSRSNS